MTDHNRDEVISAFLDQEPFDPGDLAAALSTAEGRELLIDAIGLKQLVQLDVTNEAMPARARRSSVRRWAAAAALAGLSLAGGYTWGRSGGPENERNVHRALESDSTPPQPARTITFEPGVNWHERRDGD